MSEYIDRTALKQELAPYEENDFSQQMDVILDIVDAQPAADVVEVRHGRWVVYGGGVFCSNCSTALKKGKIEPIGFHFCPNCGACMDKEADHEVS